MVETGLAGLSGSVTAGSGEAFGTSATGALATDVFCWVVLQQTQRIPRSGIAVQKRTVCLLSLAILGTSAFLYFDLLVNTAAGLSHTLFGLSTGVN